MDRVIGPPVGRSGPVSVVAVDARVARWNQVGGVVSTTVILNVAVPCVPRLVRAPNDGHRCRAEAKVEFLSGTQVTIAAHRIAAVGRTQSTTRR